MQNGFMVPDRRANRIAELQSMFAGTGLAGLGRLQQLAKRAERPRVNPDNLIEGVRYARNVDIFTSSEVGTRTTYYTYVKTIYAGTRWVFRDAKGQLLQFDRAQLQAFTLDDGSPIPDKVQVATVTEAPKRARKPRAKKTEEAGA